MKLGKRVKNDFLTPFRHQNQADRSISHTIWTPTSFYFHSAARWLTLDFIGESFMRKLEDQCNTLNQRT